MLVDNCKNGQYMLRVLLTYARFAEFGEKYSELIYSIMTEHVR